MNILHICIVVGDIQLSRGVVCILLTDLNSPHVCVYHKLGSGLPLSVVVVFLCSMIWVVRLNDIVGIIGHHCWNFLFIILIFFSPLIGFTVCLCSTLTFLVSRQDLVHIRKCKLRRKRHLKQNHKFKSFNLSILVEKHHWMKTGKTKCFLFCHLLILCASIVFFVYIYLLLK